MIISSNIEYEKSNSLSKIHCMVDSFVEILNWHLSSLSLKKFGIRYSIIVPIHFCTSYSSSLKRCCHIRLVKKKPKAFDFWVSELFWLPSGALDFCQSTYWVMRHVMNVNLPSSWGLCPDTEISRTEKQTTIWKVYGPIDDITLASAANDWIMFKSTEEILKFILLWQGDISNVFLILLSDAELS